MKKVVTLTLNPAIDGSSEAEKVRPTHKVRTSKERYDPGGGGINVARVLVELGLPAVSVYFAGGATGTLLNELLAAHAFPTHPIAIQDHTRISHTVYERSSGREFRFVPEGPTISEGERRRCLQTVAELSFDYLVASGSLPAGIHDDFYLEVAHIAAEKNARFILDTSGGALKTVVTEGRSYLVKPSLGEFEALLGRSLRDEAAQEAAAREVIREGRIEMLAVTLGHDGALLASRSGIKRLRPPKVAVKSATGAGDSFVAGMTFGLANGRSPEDAFVLGVAAGTAAVLTPGTSLCRKEDVWRFYQLLSGAAQPSPVPQAST